MTLGTSLLKFNSRPTIGLMKPSKKSDVLFAIAADNYKNDILALRKIGTYKGYSRTADKLVEYFGHVRVSTIDRADIQKYITKVSVTAGADTVRRHLIVFKAIMEYADENWEMPTRLKKPKKRKPKQEFYTFEEVRKMISHSSGNMKILMMLLAETGLRIGEALSLQCADISNGVISITKNIYEGWLQDTPKTDSSIRKIHISKTLERELRILITSDPKKFLFLNKRGRQMWPQQMTYDLREICSNAGVPYKAFHAFRRGNVTELILNLQMPERIVGYRIGHLSESITLGVYCRAMEGCDKPWIEKIETHLYLTINQNYGSIEE